VIYFVHGPDRLLARQGAQKIASEIDPDGSNTSWLDGRETPLQQVIAAIGSASFFGAARVVIVTDLLPRGGREGSSASADPDDAAPSRDTSGLKPLLEAVPEQNCLILVEPSSSSLPAALRPIVPKTNVISGAPPRGAALIAWIENATLQAGSSIDRRTSQMLAETLFPQTWDRAPNNPRYDRPPDMALLAQEIEKLAVAAHPDSIGPEHVAAHVAHGPDQRVFRFIDAALAGDLRTSFAELDRLAAAGEEPAMLLAQVLGQIELAAIATAAGSQDAGAVARDLGTITPARISAIMASTTRRQSSSHTSAPIGARTDRRLKTGRLRRPDDALHELVLELAAQQTGRPQ
jgi:DNA polymerase III delta subunit